MWMYILVTFVLGVIVGAASVWGYMDYQWKHNPYQLKAIVDRVIAKRETKNYE